jgi:hypothetical protein
MGRQLAAACRLIEKMKQQLVSSAEEIARLQSREAALAAQVAALEEQSGLALAEAGGREAGATEAHKKVRLAQDQMAKIIARHAKEEAAWAASCDALRRAADEGRLVERRLREEVEGGRARIEALERRVRRAGRTRLAGLGCVYGRIGVCVRTLERFKWVGCGGEGAGDFALHVRAHTAGCATSEHWLLNTRITSPRASSNVRCNLLPTPSHPILTWSCVGFETSHAAASPTRCARL